MILREYLIMPQWMGSERLSKQRAHIREFFIRLMHLQDGAGRFDADPAMIRTVLYPRNLAQVSVRDVQDWLQTLHAIGVIKLYTVEGRAYGKVPNNKQRDGRRKALHPDEDGEQLDFSVPPEPPPKRARGRSELNGIEEKSPLTPRPAGGDDSFSFESRTTAEARPRRTRRLPSLDTLREELAAVEAEMTAILRPGGCAYNTAPTGEKATRFDKLTKERNTLLDAIKRTRAALEAQAV